MSEEKHATLTEKAIAAMRAAVNGVVEEHRQRNKPLVVWRDGKIVREWPVPSAAVHEPKLAYPTPPKDHPGRKD